MTVIELARKIFPKMDDNELENILWSKTGFPCFFRKNAKKELRQQLLLYKRALRLGRDVCYCCGKIRHRKQLNVLGFCKIGDKIISDINKRDKNAA